MAYQKYRAKLLEKYNYCCAWCGETQNLHIDHVKTQKSGGGDAYENLQILCMNCNCSKNKWVLPKLKPREPATDRAKMLRRKRVFRELIMPFRRTYADYKFYIPKKELIK